MVLGYNTKNSKLRTDGIVNIDRGFIAHFQVLAADAPAASANGVLAATNLAAAVQAITAGITDPTVTVDADEIEKNTIDLNSALDGTQVDAYLIVQVGQSEA